MQMRHDKSSIAKKVGKVLMSFKSPSKQHPEVTYTLLAENNQNQQQKETSYADLLRRLKYWLAVPLMLLLLYVGFVNDFGQLYSTTYNLFRQSQSHASENRISTTNVQQTKTFALHPGLRPF